MRVLIAGDYCDRLRVSSYLKNRLYSDLFDDIKPIVELHDFSIVNFEFPLIKSKMSPIKKWGPNLWGNEVAAEALKYAGFNTCTLANNHILDQGSDNLLFTVEVLNRLGFNIVGAGKNLEEASQILYLEKESERLAVINCCEHEFSIAGDERPGANPLNPIKQFYSIRTARDNADYVIVIVHGGHELYQLPSVRMKNTYKYFVDLGADAVVNHHQHCYSGYEVYNGKPIFYGLGNFLFDGASKNGIWNEGYIVSLDLQKGIKPVYRVIPYNQCDYEPGVHLLKENENTVFNERLLKLNEIIANDDLLKEEFEKWALSNDKDFLSIFQPYNLRVLNGLYHRGLVPSFLNEKKLLHIHDLLRCESHLDRLRFIVDNKIEQDYD